MKNGWVLLTAVRFLKNRRATRGLATAVLSSGGIAAGVAALIVVLSVMNGFQLGFIEDILGISSYHVRMTSDKPMPDQTLTQARGLSEISSVVRFADTQTLVYGEFSGLESCRIRGVPEGIAELDPDFLEQLNIIEGSLDLSIQYSIVLGHELASRLTAGPGSKISLLTLSGAGFSSLNPATMDFIVTGIFECGYYQFDRGLAIVSLGSVKTLSGGTGDTNYGIKLHNRSGVDRAMAKLANLPGTADLRIESWRNYNRSFFGTLRTEKMTMILLLCLIFLVTGFNTYHSLKRAIYEKREQIAVLRTLGAGAAPVRWIFVIDGMAIGFAGGSVGVIAGLLVAGNINLIFRWVENVINVFLRWLGSLQDMSFFSPVYFYLTEVPIRILYPEILGIFLAGVLSSLGAAFLASMRISEIKPAQVLRNE